MTLIDKGRGAVMLFTIRKGQSSRPRANVCGLLVLGFTASVLLGIGLGSDSRPGVGRDDTQDPIIGIAHLPASVDVVMVVEEAASIRVSDAGSAVIGALVETGLLSKTTKSWEELALSLGWTPDEAFDELFGRRVVLALDEIDGKGGPRWVVLADVDESTNARIRKELKLAPRTIANNARVLAGERGRFRLAVIPGAPGSRVSSLLIAPVEHKGFFFQTLEAITDPLADVARFGDTLGYRQLKQLERRPIRVVVQPASDAGSSDTFVAMSAKCDQGDWIVHWSSSLDVLGLSSDAASEIHPWPKKAFSRLSDGALVTVMSVTGRVQTDALGTLGHVATGLLNVGGAANVFAAAGSVQMIAIHRIVPPDSTDADPDAVPQIGLTIAAQSEEPGDAAAIDEALTKFIAHVAGTSASSKLDLNGAFPGAIRSVTVDPVERTELKWFHAPGEDVTIRWSQTVTSDEKPEDAWWVVQIAGAEDVGKPSGRLCDVTRALGDEQGGPAAADRISMGVIKPRELVDWLTDLGMDATGELAVFRDIERFGWEAWITSEQLIEGQVRLTVQPRTWTER
jgi:hypothetical protein